MQTGRWTREMETASIGEAGKGGFIGPRPAGTWSGLGRQTLFYCSMFRGHCLSRYFVAETGAIGGWGAPTISGQNEWAPRRAGRQAESIGSERERKTECREPSFGGGFGRDGQRLYAAAAPIFSQPWDMEPSKSRNPSWGRRRVLPYRGPLATGPRPHAADPAPQGGERRTAGGAQRQHNRQGGRQGAVREPEQADGICELIWYREGHHGGWLTPRKV